MSIFIPCKDGFYYKIAENESVRGVCNRYTNNLNYIIYPYRYILGYDGYMYGIAYSDGMDVIQIFCKDFRTYLIKAKRIPIKIFENVEEFKNHKCSQVNPSPTVEFDGEGKVDCSNETGI